MGYVCAVELTALILHTGCGNCSWYTFCLGPTNVFPSSLQTQLRSYHLPGSFPMGTMDAAIPFHRGKNVFAQKWAAARCVR